MYIIRERQLYMVRYFFPLPTLTEETVSIFLWFS